MKPAPFAYARPEALEQVFELFEQYGDEAQLLAGGQSLIATLNMRLSTPQVLIDINTLEELSGISETATGIRIGALTRHVELENSALIAARLPLLSKAMPYIAHPAIRNRGTIGGSIALADPAAELPACALALQAQMLLKSCDGERRVRAEDFFIDLYETARRDDEVLVAVEFPHAVANTGSVFMELSRRHGDYAMAGLAVHSEVMNEQLHNLRLAFFGVAEKAILATQTANILRSAAELEVAQECLAQELQPLGDLHASSAMKLHLAKVLLKRALAELVS